ncbi:TonB-dependent receptor plug domain-containing protein [Flavobacterium sp. TP390]|uniref:TonB-dependent receptor plug domain-containing protein n=1 Tax=Flavobacterium profundi TaxID=1774945 RepID=A0A6I4IT76_9FLAO|nr:TonB-dependent receptor [Flavobacterium profundi]MVO10071.1 TonB-dependent receptor plug domain-containing protein [Flavobacterium profundi]
MRNYFLLTFLIITSLAFSQNGTVSGVISDKEYNNEPLPYANVLIKDTKTGTSTDFDGKYSLSLEAGNYTLIIGYLGYETVEIPFTLSPGEKKVINYTLAASGVQLQDVVVETTVSKEKESALLQEQQKAVEIKQAIGAQELSRKGISDAATAVTKTSGVTKQEGVKNVFVRGLGDRYNSTSLNGLPLPSEDPEYKNISLKFFPTNIIKNININKTFSSNVYGDVAGANIDIASKELEKKKYLNISLGTGYNSTAINSNFQIADGYNYFGFLENGDNVLPNRSLTTYDFDTSFKTNTKNNIVNSNFSIAAGRKFDLKDNQSLSVFGVVQSSSEYTYKEGKVGQVNATGGNIQDLDFNKSEYNSGQSILGNVKYKMDYGKSISFNTLYIHDNVQSVGDYNGFTRSVNDNPEADNSFIRRQQTNNNNLFTNQLIFDYQFSEKIKTNISLGYNLINGSEPDRRTNSYDFSTSLNSYVIATNSSSLNNRFFSKLKEDDFVGKAEVTYSFNKEEDELLKKITVGVDARKTDRRFDFTQYNFRFGSNDNVIEIDNPDAVFNQQNLDNGVFFIETSRGFNPSTAFNPYFYTGEKKLIAGYLQGTYSVNEKLIVQPGIRFEKIDQIVEWDTNLSSSVNNLTIDPSKINNNYFLPSLNVKYTLSEKNAIRLSAGQTYTYPQFKETAVFVYEGINYTSYGNPYLTASKNTNFDIKYDWYISNKEILSVTGFYKNIQDPINRVKVASAGNDFSYANTDKAFVTGIEIEARKYLLQIESDSRSKDVSIGVNASYLYSEQELKDNPNDKLTILFTNKKDKLEGATPLVINSDISYNFDNAENALTSTVVFNYFYDKIFSLGTSDNQNIVEKSIPTLDFVNKFEIKKYNLNLNLSLKNLLNPNIKLTQESTDNGITTENVVSSYKKGVFVSFGASLNF